MKNSNTALLLQELRDKQGKLAAARKRLQIKKKSLMGSVLEDTPDLFGNRKSDSGDKLFDVRVDPAQVTAALAPIQDEIASLNREIDTLTYKIIQAEGNSEPTLFDLAAE